MFGLHGWEFLIIVLLIVVLIFGPTKLPQLGRALGRTIREFRKNVSGEAEEKQAEETGEPKAEGQGE